MQEIFNKVYTHLLSQNKKSVGYNFRGKLIYKYHAPTGERCAVGCLIPDDKYSMTLEGVGFGHPQLMYLLNRLYGEKNLALIGDLYKIHHQEPVKCWKEALEEIAKIYGLICPFQ